MTSVPIRRRQKKILRDQQCIYSGHHEIQQVDIRDFPYLDHQHYDASQVWLQSHGFRYLADVENLTVTRTYPKMRTVLRRMSSSDGSISAAIYQFNNRAFSRHILKWYNFPSTANIVDLESEFSDGTFLATSNTQNLDRSGDVPGITRQQHPVETPLAMLLDSHNQAINARLTTEPHLAISRVLTASQYNELQRRLQDTKNRHKQGIGYIDKPELTRIAGTQFPDEANIVAEEIEKLKSSGKVRS